MEGGWCGQEWMDGMEGRGNCRHFPTFFFFPFLFFFFFLPVPMEGGDHFRWRIQVAKAWGRLRRRPTTAVAQDRDSGDGKGEPRKRRYGSQAVESSFRVSCGCTPQNPTAPHWHGRRLPDLSSCRRFCGEERGLRENLQRNATLSWTETAPPLHGSTGIFLTSSMRDPISSRAAANGRARARVRARGMARPSSWELLFRIDSLCDAFDKSVTSDSSTHDRRSRTPPPGLC